MSKEITYGEDLNLSVGQKLMRLHWPVIIVVCALAGIGVAALYSVADGSLQPWGDRHIGRFVALLGIVLIIAVVPREVWLGMAYPAYFVSLLLLIAVLFVGAEAGGARRWLSIGGITLQPSEFMKITLVLALARYYQWLPKRSVSHPFALLVPAMLVGAPVGLTLLQPDLGTAMIFGLVGAGILFLAGVSVFYYLAGIGAVALLFPYIWAALHDYQRKRIEVFLNPEADPLGAGYHIAQSKIALGSGGLSGRGFLQGTQAQLDFLPEKHTDFIFTTIAEEWGFIGSAVVLALFAVLVVLLIVMAIRCVSQFARLTIMGTALIVFFYVFINIAMVTGLVPVVGVPLPLVSYGGTAMTTIMIGIGLAMSAYVQRGQVMNRRRLGALW